jgi:hypothetical protein
VFVAWLRVVTVDGFNHDRWQAETGIADLKTATRGGPEVVLRSKTPAMVEQEFWTLLCVYQAIRDLISYAAPSGLDPVGNEKFRQVRLQVEQPMPESARERMV